MVTDDCKIKGTMLLGAKKYLGNQFGETYSNDKIKQYYNENMILSSSWYRADLLVKLFSESAKEKGVSNKEFIINFAKYLLESDLNGIYKFMMKLGGPKNILDGLSSLAKSYVNFAEHTAISNKDGYHNAEVIVASELSEFILFGFEGGVRGILSVCGKQISSFESERKESFFKNGILFSKYVCEVKYN